MKKVVEKKIAELVKEKGGRTFYVGGYVRDKLLGINNLDVDIEIHGISESVLLEVLNKVGTPLKYGKSFGIYSLEGQHIDNTLLCLNKQKILALESFRYLFTLCCISQCDIF